MSDTAFLERRRVRSSGLRTRGTGRGFGRGLTPGAGGLVSWPGSEVDPIRIPVIPENQTVLRELRARELALWDRSAPGGGDPVSNRVDVPKDDRESQVILLILGGAALALWLQATTAAVQFVEGWEAFRGWVSAILG